MLKYFVKEVINMRIITIKSYESRETLVTPIILLLVGVLLLLNPEVVSKFLSYIVGAVFMILGVGKYIYDSKRKDTTTADTFYSILMVIVGLVFIVFSNTFEILVRVIIGIWVLLNGTNIIASNVNTMKVHKNSIVAFIIGFILILLGLYMIIVNNLVFSTIGLILIIYSILEIINYFFIVKR